MQQPLDVLIIGSGQAGLALGHHLARSNRRVLIVDRGREVGDSWRTRWDSLRLFTPAQYNSLPGLPFPAKPDTYPGKDDVAAYLKAYAAEFDLPVQLNTTITALTRSGDRYLATAGAQTWQARQVVVATGAFGSPFVPSLAVGLDPGVHQVQSSDYRGPDAVPPGRTLVVGAGNTGCQIAKELATTRAVELAVGQRLPKVPQRMLGRDVWWWASAVRLDRVTIDSRLGRRMSTRDVLIDVGPQQLARRHRVRLKPRVTQAAGRSLTFADGTSTEYDVVLWATGFATDHSWIEIPEIKDTEGRIPHRRGVTSSPGLYLLGLQWQHTRGSALLGWVGSDAAYIADQINRMPAPTPGTVD